MGVVDGRTWLEHLSPRECWERLAAVGAGRIGVVVDGAPEIYPVNHAVDDKTIVFRTDVGNKLDAIARTPWVCFEVDGFDEHDQTGWSVLVKGRAEDVVTADEVARLADLDIRYWGVGERTHWVRIDPVEVTGRRIGHGAAS